MTFVYLANDKKIDCSQNATILEAATSQNIVLEHSCKTGRCGVCKAKVLSGSTKVLKPEECLSSQDEQNGLILTCCRTISSDTKLDIEDLSELIGVSTKTYPARIDSITSLNETTKEVTLRLPPSAKFEYVAGQYADIIGADGVRRSYSIANAPHDDGKLTFHIGKIEDGHMSDYWFNYAKENDLLRVEGPLGTFFLRSGNHKSLILLATGTGIAPIKAILEQLSSNPHHSVKEIHLYWGARFEDDLYWEPKFPELPLTYNPVLSRSKTWTGLQGYVQDAALKNHKNLNGALVYACGSDVMIQSARRSFEMAGLPARQFYSDAFVSSN